MLKTILVLCAVVCAVFGAKCGDQEFDNTNLMCCNGNITPRPDPNCVPRTNHKCCGQTGFDNREFMCCYGTINRRPDGYRDNNKCCDTKGFDNLANMCCRGVVNVRPGGDPSRHQCCGTVAFSQDECKCRDSVLTCNDAVRETPETSSDES